MTLAFDFIMQPANVFFYNCYFYVCIVSFVGKDKIILFKVF